MAHLSPSVSTLTDVHPITEGMLQIKWISLSYDGYENEKAAIIFYFTEDFESIRRVSDRTSDEVPIAIRCYDLNHDGRDEIIAFISDSYFHGASDSGGLFVLEYDGKTITDGRNIAGFQLDTSTLNDPRSEQIGIINNEEGWDDLYIDGLEWKTGMAN